MNERIEELAEESYNEFYNVHIDWKMFAELIVKECIEQCSYNAESNDEWDKGVRWAANQIKRHFGVES